jgi:uncharacterized protein YjgD (DUF1641 family)
MAQPIAFTVQAHQNLEQERVRDAPAEHAEAVLSAFELLQLLHDRGVLNLARGILAAGSEIMDLVTTSLNTPGAIRSIRNVLLFSGVVGRLSPDKLSSALDAVNSETIRQAGQVPPGMLELFRRMRTEDCRRGLGVIISLLEEFGKAI